MRIQQFYVSGKRPIQAECQDQINNGMKLYVTQHLECMTFTFKGILDKIPRGAGKFPQGTTPRDRSVSMY